jgi:hypothetical protein
MPISRRGGLPAGQVEHAKGVAVLIDHGGQLLAVSREGQRHGGPALQGEALQLFARLHVPNADKAARPARDKALAVRGERQRVTTVDSSNTVFGGGTRQPPHGFAGRRVAQLDVRLPPGFAAGSSPFLDLIRPSADGQESAVRRESHRADRVVASWVDLTWRTEFLDKPPGRHIPQTDLVRSDARRKQSARIGRESDAAAIQPILQTLPAALEMALDRSERAAEHSRRFFPRMSLKAAQHHHRPLRRRQTLHFLIDNVQQFAGGQLRQRIGTRIGQFFGEPGA